MLDVVVLLQLHAHDADAAAALLAIRVGREPLDVARLRDRDDHLLLGDHVLELELALGGDDLRAALVAAAVGLLQLEQLLADDAVDLRLVGEGLAQLADPLHQVVVLRLQPLALEPGEARGAASRGSPAPAAREAELRHQAGARLLRALGRANQRDDRVDVVERDEEALEDVGAADGVPQLELEPAGDDLALVVEVVPDELEQRQRPRHAVDERDGVVAERRLQRGVLVELVERDLRHRIALQLDRRCASRPCRTGP